MYNVIDHGDRIQIGTDHNQANEIVMNTFPKNYTRWVDGSEITRILDIRGADIAEFILQRQALGKYFSVTGGNFPTFDVTSGRNIEHIEKMRSDYGTPFGRIGYGITWVYKERPEGWPSAQNMYYDMGIVKYLCDNIVAFISYLDSTRTSTLLLYAQLRFPENNKLLTRCASVNTVMGVTDTSVDMLKSILLDGGCNLSLGSNDDTNRVYLQVFSKEFNIRQSAISNFNDTMAASYMSAVKSVRSSMEDAIRKSTEGLESRMSAERQKIVRSTYALALDLKDRGWEMKDNYLVYPARVFVTKVQDRAGKVYNLPEELTEHFYIENIRVPISTSIQGVKADGHNPHMSSGGSMCVGTLAGKDISYLRLLPDMFSTINYDSMYGGMGSIAVGILMGRYPQVECKNRGSTTCNKNCTIKDSKECDGTGIRIYHDIENWYKYKNWVNEQIIKPTNEVHVYNSRGQGT